MADFVTLTCLSCGGKLEITKDIERFACGYCGNEQIVKRSGGIVSLELIANDIKSMKIGVDKTAAELAIPRIKKEVEELELYFSSKEIQILDKSINHDILNFYASTLMYYLHKSKYNQKVDSLKERCKIFKSLSNNDIDFCLEQWPNIWSLKSLERTEVISLLHNLTSVKNLREEKDNSVHEKKSNWINYCKLLIQSETT